MNSLRHWQSNERLIRESALLGDEIDKGAKRRRHEDAGKIEGAGRRRRAYVPYFPLGGFTPLQTGELSRVADEMGQSPQSVALAWLLNRSPNILLIPGTSRRTHLRENVAAAGLPRSEEHRGRLNGIANMR